MKFENPQLYFDRKHCQTNERSPQQQNLHFFKGDIIKELLSNL